MNWIRSMTLLLLSVAVLPITGFSQDLDEDSNWLKEIRGQDDYYSRFDFKHYTKRDVVKAKLLYQTIASDKDKNDWHGEYSLGVEVGKTEFHWSTSGYVSFYVYHTLDGLDFGSVKEDADTVQVFSETEASAKKRQIVENTYVKVKYGDRRFLVPEKRLQAFLNRAVGRDTSITDYGYYLEMVADENSKVFGLPVVPAKYRALVSSPIETTIRRVGKRKIHQNKFPDGRINYEEVYRYVDLASGSSSGVVVGMNFYVDDLGEWVEITAVRPKNSTGRIRRGLDEGKEDCFDSEQGNGDLVPCKQPRAGLRARTKMSELYF